MKKREILDLIPEDGFIKVPETGSVPLSSERKVILMRKGNQLFNEGDVETAGRIFITIGYTDGLIRVGDYYYSHNRTLEALRMYKAAPAQDKVDMIAEKMAYIVRGWLETNL
ncbi:MAG: hypothetical protein PQJ58_21370 [Spirochaetales bacterium]|nr:hypothetical protein [Spirochaetales bacterium]